MPWVGQSAEKPRGCWVCVSAALINHRRSSLDLDFERVRRKQFTRYYHVKKDFVLMHFEQQSKMNRTYAERKLSL